MLTFSNDFKLFYVNLKEKKTNKNVILFMTMSCVNALDIIILIKLAERE